MHPGQLIHISGINGSGKSTLFKIITGLIAADQGTVKIDNEDIIGALIENPGFLEYENAMTNLKFLGNLNKRFNQTKVIDLMNQFELSPNGQQSVSKYSVGMRQKLGIIQAVMEDQNIILLDEPTRGLDANGIKQFIILLETLKKENKSVIVASHDYIEGLVYNKSLNLKNGQLIDK
ncbi:ABC transporter ATP-binding protein [Melissococcus plutonius]|nr:ABC transporter ATP-binding protein [Melissococcus plutonius]